jgi:RimJ/RimL family protein N-acetyltransferase
VTEFSSDRLDFRTWRGDEEERLRDLMQDERMPEFWRPRWQGEKCGAWIAFQQAVYAQHRMCSWALWHRADEALIGFCGLVPMIETGELEIWWALGCDYWRQGLAGEAARRVAAYAKWRGHEQLVALTQPHNERSQRLADRIGMQCEGEIEWYGATAIRYVMALDAVTPIAP